MVTEDQTIDDIEAVVSIAGRVSLDVIAEVVGVSSETAVDAIEQLEGEGRVEATRTGVTGGDRASVSETRRVLLASRLAAALESSGASDSDIARAAWAGGDATKAHRHWAAAALAGDDGVLDDAVIAGREANVDDSELAPLLVRRARASRNRGESEAAMADLDGATPHLEGDDLIDALAFAAVVLDDLQRPSAAERTVAMAMLVAGSTGSTAKLASLMALHGRMLVRLGFDREAEDSFDRAEAIGESEWQAPQRYFAGLNRAWSDLDRGWAARAEQRYAVARDRAASFEGEGAVADKDIALARARFLTGDAEGALDALARARRESEAPVVDFLATLAETEGALAFGRAEEARAKAADLQEIVAADFPQWSNRASAIEARAHLLGGDRAAARNAVASARETTPRGADGARLRAELDGLELEASEHWASDRAADVADRLLQSGWVLAAARLMTERARRESDSDVARTAAALAHRSGAPLAAADAIEAGDLWSDPVGGPIALAIHRIQSSVPEEWLEDWRSRPTIEHALATDAVVTDEGALQAHLDTALRSVGLGADDAASPAQRRAAGLVSVGRAARTIGRFAAWAVGVATIAAVVAIAVQPDLADTTQEDLPPPTSTTTTTTIPPLLERIVPTPDVLGGQHPFGGGDHRNSVIDAVVGEPIGIYFRSEVTGFLEADAVMRGRGIFVGTSLGYSTMIDLLNDGAVIYDEQYPGAFDHAVTIGQVDYGQDDQDAFLAFFGTDDGTVVVRPINDTAPEVWREDLGSPITGPPLVRTTSMIFATEDGVLHDRYPADGTPQRRFPAEGAEPDGFEGPLAAADDFIYARTGGGEIVVIRESTFEEVCRVEARIDGAATTPVVAGDIWVVGTSAQTVKAFGAGTCARAGVGTYAITTNVTFDPVVADGLVWVVSDSNLLPVGIEDGQSPFVAAAGSTISTAPVVTSDSVIVGTTDGELVAFDRTTGDVRWTIDIGPRTRQRVAVADDLIVVVGNQELIALAAPVG